MTFKFYLRSPQKDIPAGKQKPTPIILSISHKGKVTQKYIGISVLPSQFKKQRTKDEKVNDELRHIENVLNERLNQFSTRDDIEAAVNSALNKTSDDKADQTTTRMEKVSGGEKQAAKTTFLGYFDTWANLPTPNLRQKRNTLKLIKTLMGENIGWDDVNDGFYLMLTRKMGEMKYSINYIGSVVSKLKTVMSEGYKLGYHTNTAYHNFSRPKEDSSAIALTEDEIQKLLDVKLASGSLEEKVRDLFLIGYYTGARFGDYSRLTMESIRSGKVEYYQNKTGDYVVIPASPKLVNLLRRNGGKAPDVGQVVFNRYIKKVAMLAGINGEVPLPKDKRKESGKPTYRWEMVSSHTPRRSLATNLYLKGVTPKEIMAITGHTSLSAFEAYLRISKEQAVMKLAKLEFFK